MTKSTHIPKFHLASRGLPENFLYEIFLQPKIHVAEDGTSSDSNKTCDGGKSKPHGIVFTAALAHGNDRKNQSDRRCKTDKDPAPGGVLVMEGEADHGVDGAEQEPGGEQVEDDGQQVDATALGSRGKDGGRLRLSVKHQGCRFAAGLCSQHFEERYRFAVWRVINTRLE